MRKYTAYFKNKITIKNNSDKTTFNVSDIEMDDYKYIGSDIIEIYLTNVNFPKVIIIPVHNILSISLN